MPSCFRYLLLLSMLACFSSAFAAEQGDRLVTVSLNSAIGAHEGVVISMTGGPDILLERLSDTSFQGYVNQQFLERTFIIKRVPGNVPEVGYRGQGIPLRAVAPSAGPHWIFPIAWQDRLPQAQEGQVTGTVEEHMIENSPYVPGPRKIRIWLPPSYKEDSERFYPVVYMLDGQNVYNPALSFGGVDWCCDEVATKLAQDENLEAIYVGVDNGCGRRLHEYTFCKGTIPGSQDQTPKGGGAAEHLKFLLQSVDPFVRANYRTNDEKASLVGSSLGGLFGLWTALTHPDAFAAIGVISPSVWWADKAIVDVPLADCEERPRLWMDIGTKEGENSVHNLWLAYCQVKELGWQEGEDFRCAVIPGGAHHESAWAFRLAAILRFTLAGRR